MSQFFFSKQWKREENLLEIMHIACAFFILASVFHLTFIAVDRPMIILIPFQNETIFTAQRQKFGIILLWILAVVISSITYIYYIISTSESIISSIRNYLNTRRNTLASIPPN